MSAGQVAKTKDTGLVFSSLEGLWGRRDTHHFILGFHAPKLVELGLKQDVKPGKACISSTQKGEAGGSTVASHPGFNK